MLKLHHGWCLCRWPRTLAGITAYLPCARQVSGAVIYSGGSVEDRRASRQCDRSGHWNEGDYTRCEYMKDTTRVLHIINQVFFFKHCISLYKHCICTCISLFLPTSLISPSTALYSPISHLVCLIDGPECDKCPEYSSTASGLHSGST